MAGNEGHPTRGLSKLDGPRVLFGEVALRARPCYLSRVHTSRNPHTEVAATVAGLRSRGHAPSVAWVREGARVAAYLCTVVDGVHEAVSRIDDVTDERHALGRDRATWVAVEAGAGFRIAPRRFSHANTRTGRASPPAHAARLEA